MPPCKIRLVYGWCGNLRLIVAERLEEIFTQAEIQFKMSHQSVWDNPEPPRSFDLVLQLMPVFTESETGCPVINIKPLLVELNHQPTIEKVMRYINNRSSIIAGENEPSNEANDVTGPG